jgi:hypothetical protein
MAKPIGPKKVHRYTNEFKVQAVRLSACAASQSPWSFLLEATQALSLRPDTLLPKPSTNHALRR